MPKNLFNSDSLSGANIGLELSYQSAIKLGSDIISYCISGCLSLIQIKRIYLNWMNSAIPSSGLQLRKSEQNDFHDNFLMSQPNPIFWPSLKSSRRDDSNEWSHHRVWLRNKTAFWKLSILDLICCPDHRAALNNHQDQFA